MIDCYLNTLNVVGISSMLPTFHFSGVYGDMEDYESSTEVTTNPMDTSIRERKDKGKGKAKEYDESVRGNRHELDANVGFDQSRKCNLVFWWSWNHSHSEHCMHCEIFCRYIFFHAANFAFQWSLWRHGRG